MLWTEASSTFSSKRRNASFSRSHSHFVGELKTVRRRAAMMRVCRRKIMARAVFGLLGGGGFRSSDSKRSVSDLSWEECAEMSERGNRCKSWIARGVGVSQTISSGQGLGLGGSAF